LEIDIDPMRFPKYMFSTRACAISKFPYLIVFHDNGFSVKIVAFAHAKRRPGYWRRRLRRL
jgi:hypothetical protein